MKLSEPDLLRVRSFVNGRWVDGDEEKTFSVTDPATGGKIADVADLGAEETARAVQAAHDAMPGWRAKTAKERAMILRRWNDLMVAHQDDLALLMTMEQGKSLTEAKGEILYAASFVEWFAEEGKRVYGETVPSFARDKRLLVLKQPIGVAAAITPWNFPAAMITRKAAPALAAGCSMVVKPSKETPLSALALARLAELAGVPAGVLNVVTGSRSGPIGDVLSTHPLVRKLSFTGSTEIGKLLMEKAAGTVKKVSMELGGNAPFIVFADADLDAAVSGAIASKFRNSGQTCVCANRFLVEDGIYDAFAEKFTRAVSGLRVGDGRIAGTEQGPLINDDAIIHVEDLVADALAKGGRILTGGKKHALGGRFFEPTVIIDAAPDMRFAKEEIFGPVAPLFRFSSEEEAIRMANDTNYGLAAYFYSRDVGRVVRVMEALESGLVGVNEGLMANEATPFGGVKESGVGREGSKYGIEEYLETKYACLGGI